MQGRMPDITSQGSNCQDDWDARYASVEAALARARAIQADIAACSKVSLPVHACDSLPVCAARRSAAAGAASPQGRALPHP